MSTTLTSSQSTSQRSFRDGLKNRFWSGMNHPEGYIRTLRWLTPFIRQDWLWNEKRLLHRLASLEQVALWKGEAWRSHSAVEQARSVFLRALREVTGPRLKSIGDEGERRRLNQLLAKIEARLGVIDPYCRPTRARLELTDACNLRCPMCPQSFWKWDRNYAGEWILERARTLYPWLTALDFTSFGETLLSPLFKKAVCEAPSHTHTLLITNGLLVDDEMAMFLCSHHISELHVSIDAASREAYQAMRVVDAFERVIENCRRLVRAKAQVGSENPTLVFNFTLNRKNIDELVPLIGLAREIGFQRVHINYLMVWTTDQREDSIYWIRERTCEVIGQAEQVARQCGVEFFHPPKPLPEHEGVERFERYCPEPWEFIHLRAHGRLSVCCMSADEFEVPEGMGWEEIWDSPAYQDFRRRVNLPDEEAPPLCRHCFFGRNIQPGDPRYHFFDAILSEHVTGSPKDPYLREEGGE